MSPAEWPFREPLFNLWFWTCMLTIVLLVVTAVKVLWISWPEVKVWWRSRNRGITVLLPEDEERS